MKTHILNSIPSLLRLLDCRNNVQFDILFAIKSANSWGRWNFLQLKSAIKLRHVSETNICMFWINLSAHILLHKKKSWQVPFKKTFTSFKVWSRSSQMHYLIPCSPQLQEVPSQISIYTIKASHSLSLVFSDVTVGQLWSTGTLTDKILKRKIKQSNNPLPLHFEQTCLLQLSALASLEKPQPKLTINFS